MRIYRASMETRHFTFEAFHTTPEWAMDTLSMALAKHCDQVQIDFDEFIKAHDIEEHVLIMGAGYRDNEKIYQNNLV